MHDRLKTHQEENRIIALIGGPLFGGWLLGYVLASSQEPGPATLQRHPLTAKVQQHFKQQQAILKQPKFESTAWDATTRISAPQSCVLR